MIENKIDIINVLSLMVEVLAAAMIAPNNEAIKTFRELKSFQSSG